MDKGAYLEARKTWLCEGCCRPKPEVGPVDVVIQENRPKPVPLTLVGGCGVGLVQRDFLEALGQENVAKDLLLGKVYGTSGKELGDWATFSGHSKVHVRGTKKVGARRCERCKRILYYAEGSRYLCPLPPITSAIHESDLWGIVIAESLYQEFERRRDHRWSRLGVEKLKALENPKDSLPRRLADL